MSRIRVRTGKDQSAARAGALGLVLVLLAAGTFAVRLMGYKLGRETIVRCRDGHLFTTIWIPGASIKAVRLGMLRWQRCPVGKHWTLVSPVREADLTDAERELAALSHDVRVP
jgi:hypothetical protein